MYASLKVLLTVMHTAMILNMANSFIFPEKEMIEITTQTKNSHMQQIHNKYLASKRTNSYTESHTRKNHTRGFATGLVLLSTSYKKTRGKCGTEKEKDNIGVKDRIGNRPGITQT